jgi:hypothetical protein
MQRLFSMFPAGGPGTGLLLLRLSLAAILVVHMWARPAPATYAWLAPSLASFLTVGLFTPIVAALGGLLELTHAVLSRGDVLPAGVHVAQAVAVALLGPGAYSVDALWYGRRLVRGPSTRDTDRL